MVIVDKDEVFYDCAKSFIIWETFLFYVWSFSMFASSFYALCSKVCNLVQTLAETQLIQSRKNAIASYHLANPNMTQKPNEPKCTQNPFLETCLERKCTLLPPFPNSKVLTHIFHFVVIDPVNASVASSNKQTLISHCGWECSLEHIGGS